MKIPKISVVGVPTEVLTAVALLLGLVAGPSATLAEPPVVPAGEVSLPLKDYLALLTEAEAADDARNAKEEKAFSELVSQKTVVRVDGDLAEIDGELEVQVTGAMKEPVPLPFAGLADSAAVAPAGASVHWCTKQEGTLCLAASRPGRFRVTIKGRRQLREGAQGLSLTLPPSPSAVASVDLELAPGLAWSLEGAAVVADEVAEIGRAGDGRGLRRVSLAPRRGEAHELRISRKGEGAEADRTLARAAVVTLVELSGSGIRRHDLIHYDVLRGELSQFKVQLPASLAVERAGTDEGEALAPRSARGQEAELVIPRETRLTSSGYLYLSSEEMGVDEALESLPLEPVVPEVEVRSRYLVTIASAAVSATPLPASAWRQVDLEDLPPAFAQTILSAKPSAAWRRVDGPPEEPGESPRLVVRTLPAAPLRSSLVVLRETYTLLTLDGTLVHRETFDVRRGGSALELELPGGAVLWTATVDGQPVRPVERGNRLAVPLSFTGESAAQVQVVAVQERAIPKGRSDLAMDLPRLDVPVLEHRWNVLLPEGNRYRYGGGSLRRAEAPPRSSSLSFSSQPSFARDLGAQASKGTAALRGEVTAGNVQPPSEARVPGAVVMVDALEGQVRRSTVTDSEGKYWLRDLPAGKYRVEVSLPGFISVEREVRLIPGHAGVMNAELELAMVAETIVVTGESAVVQDRLTQKELDEQNVAVARSFYLDNVFQMQAGLQGIVGGVKPLTVDVPEEGKGIFLAGALPPRVVSLTLDVRAGR